MKNTTYYRSLTTLAALLTSALVGCSHNQPAKIHGEEFTKDCVPTSTGEFAQAQCAAGAMQDGMLYDMNFHGTQLNSLGQGKLNLILKGTVAGDSVYVYLNMPHDQVALRQAAVTDYLKTAGVIDTKIVVAEGPNLNQTTPTAYNLQHIYNKDGTSFNGEASKDDAGAGGGGAAGGMGGAAH